MLRKILLVIFLTVSVAFSTTLDDAKSYSATAYKYYQDGNYPKALEFHAKALNIQEKFLGKDNINIANSYNYIGGDYIMMENYPRALEFLTKALNIEEKVLGKDHPDTATSYYVIGGIYKNIGNYPKALEFYTKALNIDEKVLGKDHPDTANSYNNIGNVYNKIGNYPKALEFYTKALSIKEKVLGKDHPGTANSYNNIGYVYGNMGDYAKALEFHTKALDIHEKVLGKDHPDTATSYNDIGSVYSDMGNYSKALEFYTKALNIYEKVLGKDHPYTATSYNHVGLVYSDMGDYPKALEFYTKALDIREKVLGKDHPDTASSYNNIGSVYSGMGDYAKALEFHTKALDIDEKVLGKDHISSINIYNNIGNDYYYIGNYPKALEFHVKALNIHEKVLDKDHPHAATIYNNIGYVYNKMGDYLKAYSYSKKAYYVLKLNRDKNFEILSNEQKKKFLEANHWYLPHLLTSGYSYQQATKDKKALSQEIYEIFINDKGILLDDENTIAMLKNISQDKNLISKIDSLNSLKRAYAKLAGTMPKPEEAKSYQEKLKALGEDIEKAEIEIAKISPKFKQELGIKDLKLSDLTSLLKPNELFVDIGYDDKNYYIFSVDKSGEVKFEKLNDKDSDTVNTTIKEFRADIDKIINATDANSTKALKELYSIVIEKGIGDRMDKFNSLIISTDGALRLLPFEALMDGDKYLIESKQIRYTPSAKEFIRTHKFNIKDEGKDITMFSDPNYESKSGKIMEMVADTPNVDKAMQTRSIKNMGTFKRLRGFKKEEEVLQSSFSGVKLFSRENANEENILAVKSPKILHITTHGYFISDENITNPMLKSGVALSGANIGIKQQTGEGLVNALKLSGLSLDGTDLVVLSACETGLVDVKDTSSVASLPKTFIQAGSKNVLMSLWSVDDNSTVELMKEFYTDTKGNEKKFNEVLRNAKIKMIKEGKHPFYWAAFIMSGE